MTALTNHKWGLVSKKTAIFLLKKEFDMAVLLFASRFQIESYLFLNLNFAFIYDSFHISDMVQLI